LPIPAQAGISATLGRDNASYHAVARESGFRADNAPHRLKAGFTLHPRGRADPERRATLGAGSTRLWTG
jgi:hypothetical protein